MIFASLHAGLHSYSCTPARALSALVAAAAITAMPLQSQTPPAAGRGSATAAAPDAAPAAAGIATVAAAGTGLPAPRESWTSDRRKYAVGDIITVLIDDYTITTAVKENVASDSRSRGLGLTARLPGGASKGAGLDTKNDASQNERGSAKRENRFQNEMSVRVVSSAANGLLQVKGIKKINVDKQMQDIELAGWLRTQDVSMQNTIESARIADVQIGYASPGNLSKPKQGLISKVLGALWP